MIRRHRKVKKSSLRYEVILDGAVRVYPDGREVCQENDRGRIEYRARIHNMQYRQNWECCICGKKLDYLGLSGTWTFEHSDLRGMGSARRDDRIVDADGKPMNGAAHFWCNAIKASRR